MKGELLAGFLGWASISGVSGPPTNSCKDWSGLGLKGERFFVTRFAFFGTTVELERSSGAKFGGGGGKISEKDPGKLRSFVFEGGG